jgi:hypothetical protein
MAIYGGQVRTTPYQAPDYGPSVAAAKELAMTGAQGIAGMVGQVGDYFKQQKESKNSALMGLKIAEAAKIMDPAQAPYYDNIINTLKDENTPVDVRGALGAQVQDLLKQNTSMRAVAVQEAQLGGLPTYFGGAARTQPRSYGGGGGYSRQVDMSAGDRALANQPPGSQGMIPDEPLVLPGEAGADVVAIEQKIQKAQQLGIPAEQINPIVTGIQSALSTPFAETQNAVQAYNKNLDTMIANAAQNLEPAKDPKGQPQVVISEDESGNISRFTRTRGGNLITPYGEVLTPQGKPIEQQQYKKFDVEAINRALYGDGELLPPLPPDDAGTLPPEASRTAPPSFQELTAVPPTPEGGVQMIGEQEPQPEQKSAGLGLMAAESVAKKKEKAQSREAIAQEYNTLTKLTPRKQNLFNSALNQAYQDVATAPSENVVKEMELQLLMQLESKSPQMMSEEEYNRRNISTINKAKIRARDRAGMYKILERFDVIQQLANHPEASNIFGQSIPAEKLKELARTEGGVYALYDNLKGQDLVQAMREIKEQSGTAAQMSERETFALQAAVSDFSLKQDWQSAQKSLMKMANTAIRAGKNLGADDSIFDTMPMTPATATQPASKRQTTKANEILNAAQTLPLFKDEIKYFNRVNELQNRLQTSQGAGTTQQATPSFDPYGQAYKNLQQQDQRFFPK